MINLIRKSPVQFDVESLKAEDRENWSVVLQYENEGQGPWLVDLGHKNRFDLQNHNVDELTVVGVDVPSVPGMSIFKENVLVSRLNVTQVSVACLGKDKPSLREGESYTDVSEATVFLALFGPNTFRVAEKLTALDFLAPEKKVPFLYQGPFCHVPCHIVTLKRDTDGSGGILISCSRGYAESMVNAILDSGSEFGLSPAGEDRFTAWVDTV